MRILYTCCLMAFFGASPLWAEGDAAGSAGDGAEEQSLMELGAELLRNLDDLRQELDPALDDFQALADEMGPALSAWLDEMGPALAELLDEIEDMSQYEAPEVLPNGDILIRRKPDVPQTKEGMLGSGETEI